MPSAAIRGLRISYFDTGSGTPVVLIPGLGGCKEWFEYQFLGLADCCRVVSYDPTPARWRRDYSLESLAEELRLLLGALRVRNAVIVGHSFGALVALQFALANPQQTLGLALCSTAPGFADVTGAELIAHFARGGARSEGFLAALWGWVFGSLPTSPRPSPARRGSVEGLAIPTSPQPSPGRRGSLDMPDRRTLDAAMRVLRETDFTPMLREIVCPTLLVAGSTEAPFVLAGAQAMDMMIPQVRLEVVEDADQFYFRTRHDVFNEIIDEWAGTFAE